MDGHRLREFPGCHGARGLQLYLPHSPAASMSNSRTSWILRTLKVFSVMFCARATLVKLRTSCPSWSVAITCRVNLRRISISLVQFSVAPAFCLLITSRPAPRFLPGFGALGLAFALMYSSDLSKMRFQRPSCRLQGSRRHSCGVCFKVRRSICDFRFRAYNDRARRIGDPAIVSSPLRSAFAKGSLASSLPLS